MVLRQQSPRQKSLSPISPRMLLFVEYSRVSIPFYFDNIIKTILPRDWRECLQVLEPRQACYSRTCTEKAMPFSKHAGEFPIQARLSSLFGVLERTVSDPAWKTEGKRGKTGTLNRDGVPRNVKNGCRHEGQTLGQMVECLPSMGKTLGSSQLCINQVWWSTPIIL